MLTPLLLFAAPVLTPLPPLDSPIREIVQGPMPGENHTLSMPHRNMDDRMFPDIAVGDLRIDGDTLYVRVINQGRVRAQGPIRVAARAEANGVKSDASPASISNLKPGESRWVALRHFSAHSAAAFTLEKANVIIAAVRQSAPVLSPELYPTGQGCDRCFERNEANNGVTAAADTIPRGRPD